ncbi:MAG: hypothetical protein UX26_C0001G0024 [Parcubacteria group bacterium GW2011_GWC1_45_9]|nr:MAG: hypothetical protein UX26_C0001G0024 [Parcubacteria group bacterium GW2011_GWC1_45_9]
MTIYWHGLSCFKIETNDLTIGLNPFAKNEKLGIAKSPRFKAQALLISSPDELYNYSGSIDGSPMIIDHAGEFELSGCFIYGIQGQAKFFKAKDKQNTVFVIKSEDLWLAHLGAFSGSKMKLDSLEKFIKEVNLKPENEEKLLLKSRSLDEEKTRLVILSS